MYCRRVEALLFVPNIVLQSFAQNIHAYYCQTEQMFEFKVHYQLL